MICASGSRDKSAIIWDLSTGAVQMKLRGFPHDVSSVCFSPDGLKLATGCYLEVKVWDSETGEQLSTIKHPNSVSAICFDNTSTMIASATGAGLVLVNHLLSGLVVRIEYEETRVRFLAFSPLDNFLTTSMDNITHVFNIDTNEEIESPYLRNGRVFDISTDGYSILATDEANQLTVWEVSSWTDHLVIPITMNIVDAKFNSTASQIVASLRQHSHYSMSLWSCLTGTRLVNWSAFENCIGSLCFALDDSVVITVFEHDCKMLYVWDARTGKETTKLAGHTASVRRVCVRRGDLAGSYI